MAHFFQILNFVQGTMDFFENDFCFKTYEDAFEVEEIIIRQTRNYFNLDGFIY